MLDRSPHPARRRVAGGRCAALLAGIAVCGASPSWAQQSDASATEADARIEAYLERLDLREALGVQLRDHLDRARPEAGAELAARLADLYVERLERAQSPSERQEVERLARELLASAPEAETYRLRINLEKARYLEAERIAERDRLGLAEPESLEEARRILREVRDSFRRIGSSTHRRVERLEEIERRGREEDEALLESELSEARRLRSLAMYYSGWSNYYLAMLTDSTKLAIEAIEDFGWLLDSAGESRPEIDKVPESLLRFEHVARAALGVALGHSLRGAHGQALQWLDLVRSSERVPQAIREELVARRLVIYAAARRWADIEWMIHQLSERSPDDGIGMSVLDARLLVVLILEAETQTSGPPERSDLLDALVQTGLAALVRHGEVGHVLDLMEKYGTTPIGEDGFIVQYVTGLQSFEEAREAHREQADDPSEPTESAVVASRYRIAAAHLREAHSAEDAESFPAERAKCGVQLGLALYYADEPKRASEAFERAWEASGERSTRERALWFAIVAADRWSEIGDPAEKADERADRLAMLYLEQFPRSERAAKLVLRRADASLVGPARAAEILLGVPSDSAIYGAARRRAADLLYRAFKAAPREKRAFAALRFIEIAREAARMARADLREGGADAEASQRLLVRYRQLLDAYLELDPPDGHRAAEIIDQIESLARETRLSLQGLEGELNYRRVQIALVTRDAEAIDEAVDRLRSLGGPYASAADTLLYRDAYERWQRSPEDAALAEEVLRHGTRLADRRLADGGAIDRGAVRTLLARVARAGRLLWEKRADEIARDIAIRMDARLIEAGVRTPEVLLRHATLAEAASSPRAALDSWRTLLSAAPESSELWYRARANSLGLLAEIDPERARQVLQQYRTLNPDLGPEPWRTRISAVARKLGAQAESDEGP